MEWTNENVLRFIELYQMHPCLWNPKNPNNKVKDRRNEAWTNVRKLFGEPLVIKDLKRKRNSLMSAYRWYKTKVKESERSGTTHVYDPPWFAFPLMDSFLGNVYKCGLSKNKKNSKPQAESDIIDLAGNTGAKNQGTSPIASKRKCPNNSADPQNEEEDEYSIFGKFIAKKMRKLSEDRRDIMVIKITQLFYDECQENMIVLPHQ